MELPDDVLAIVRAFAKPYFKYFREYNQALQVLGKNKWHPLKDKLLTHGEKIVPILLPYMDAYLETKMRRQALLNFVNPLKKVPFMNNYVYFMERERQVELFWASRKIEDDLYRALVKEVYDIRLAESELYVEQS
jgi:hypothetical protein